MAFDFPTSPAIGAQYVAPTGKIYLYDNNSSWTLKGDTQTTNPFVNSFRYRTIYTRGYMSAGYKSGTPWRNVNRTQHATDVTTNLGDMLDYAASYIDGGWSDYYHYVYNMSDAVQGSSNRTSSVNMQTESIRTVNTAWYTTSSRTDLSSMMNSNLTICYITHGGSAATDKHSMVTETMLAAGSVPNNPLGVGGTAGGSSRFFGEFSGWINYSGASASLSWSSETWTSGGLTFAATSDGQPKGLSSKLGFAYCATGSYGGSATYYKYNDVIGGSSVLSISRPEPCGEENQQVGQNWGYTVGSYNGSAQTNNTQKTNYLTDTCIAMGSETQPKGHDGASSGCTASASAMFVGGV
jgi:hypothetical protein